MTGRELQYRSDCKLYHTGVTDILPVAVEENTIRTDSQAILRKIKPPRLLPLSMQVQVSRLAPYIMDWDTRHTVRTDNARGNLLCP